MLYTIEAIFKGLQSRTIKYTKDGEQKEFTINEIVLENPNNMKHMEDISYNEENFKIDESKFKGKTVICPVYLNKNTGKDGKQHLNFKLRGDVVLVEDSEKNNYGL